MSAWSLLCFEISFIYTFIRSSSLLSLSTNILSNPLLSISLRNRSYAEEYSIVYHEVSLLLSRICLHSKRGTESSAATRSNPLLSGVRSAKGIEVPRAGRWIPRSRRPLLSRICLHSGRGVGSPPQAGSESFGIRATQPWIPHRGPFPLLLRPRQQESAISAEENPLGGKMADSSECFNIGSTVSCVTCFDEELQGEVLAFDSHVKLLTLSILLNPVEIGAFRGRIWHAQVMGPPVFWWGWVFLFLFFSSFS